LAKDKGDVQEFMAIPRVRGYLSFSEGVFHKAFREIL
jgi:hypothetical protein